MFFELPWVGVAMDAMTVAIYIKYSYGFPPAFYYYFPRFEGVHYFFSPMIMEAYFKWCKRRRASRGKSAPGPYIPFVG